MSESSSIPTQYYRIVGYAEHEPVTATEDERPTLSRITHLLAREQARRQTPLLVGSDGECIPLPESLLRVLRRVVIALGRACRFELTAATRTTEATP